MGIEDYSTTAANNNSAPPNGFPEGMAPSAVNNAARQVMADIRTWYETAEWTDLGDTITYVSGTEFSVVGDLTATYEEARRVRAVGSSTGTIYGVISASSFSSPNTTVTVVWDSGSLVNETLAVSLGIISTDGAVDVSALSGHSTFFAEGLEYDSTTRTVNTGYVEKATASNSAALEFTDLASGYNHYFKLRSLLPASDGAQLQMRTSPDTGGFPTFDTGATDYKGMKHNTLEAGGTSTVTATDGATTKINLSSGVDDTVGDLNGIIWIMDPTGTTFAPQVFGKTYSRDANGFMSMDRIQGYRQSTAAVNAVQFTFSTGNIASGVIEHWMEEIQ